jgi:hypothetical protein
MKKLLAVVCCIMFMAVAAPAFGGGCGGVSGDCYAPGFPNTGYLGTSTFPWGYIYGQTITGTTLNGQLDDFNFEQDSGATTATLTAAGSGEVYHNDQASGATVTYTLPLGSTLSGGEIYMFVDTAGTPSGLIVDCGSTNEQILGETNAAGDSITSTTAGNTITLMFLESGVSDYWVPIAAWGTWADSN